MSSDPKLHHYLPQAFLRGFADSDGTLWTYDRRTQEVRKQRPEISGAEHELYTIETDGKKNRRREQLLAQCIDGPGLSALRSLHTSAVMTPIEVHSLAAFVASLFVRTPAQKRFLTQFSEAVRAMTLKTGVSVDTASEPDPPGHVKRKSAVRADIGLAELERQRAERRPYHNTFVRVVANLVPTATDALLKLQWVIAAAPEGKAFVTADRPTIVFAPPNHPPIRGFGVLTPGSQKVVPLSARLALLMFDQVPGSEIQRGTIRPEHLRHVNEALVANCHRFVFCPSEALIRSLIAKVRPSIVSPAECQVIGPPLDAS
jgi:hypothetical protein